jgi:hypothetical protein
MKCVLVTDHDDEVLVWRSKSYKDDDPELQAEMARAQKNYPDCKVAIGHIGTMNSLSEVLEKLKTMIGDDE